MRGYHPARLIPLFILCTFPHIPLSTFYHRRYITNVSSAIFHHQRFFTLRSYGQSDAATQQHGGHSLQRNKARAHRAPIPVAQRLSLPAEQSAPAWPPRPRAPQISYLHLRQRLLLAWARRLWRIPPAQDQRGVLAKEDRTKQGARLRRAKETRTDGLALHHGVGMRTQNCSAPANAGSIGTHAQPHLPTGPQSTQRADPLQTEGGGRNDGNGSRARATR